VISEPTAEQVTMSAPSSTIEEKTESFESPSDVPNVAIENRDAPITVSVVGSQKRTVSRTKTVHPNE